MSIYASVSSASIATPISPTNGGTGVSNPTAHTVPVAEGASPFNFVGPGTTGQVLSGNTGADPSFSTLTAGTNVSITTGVNTITISSAPTWTDTSGNVAAAANNGYFTTGATTSTLPASPSEGNTIAYIIDNASTLTITGNTGQKIRVGAALSAVAGTCASGTIGNSVTLVYRTADTTWIAQSVVGTWTVT